MTDLLTLFNIDNPPLPIRRRPPVEVTPSLVSRFMSKVYVDYGMPDGCWIWTGSRHMDGYGELKVENKNQRTHRVAYQLFVDPIKDNLLVCHICDNSKLACSHPPH